MQLLGKTNIDFMGRRRAAFIVSIALLLVSLGSLVARGLNFGIEFTGGIVIEAGFPSAADLPRIRADLGVAGFGEADSRSRSRARSRVPDFLPSDAPPR